MKGFGRHIAASMAITAVFVVCALAIGVAAVPATSPAKNTEETGAFAYGSLFSGMILEGEAAPAATTTVVPAPAAPQAGPATVSAVQAPAPAVKAPEVAPTDPANPQPAAPPAPSPYPVLNPPKDLTGVFVPDQSPYVKLAWDPNNPKKAYDYFNVYRMVAGDSVEANVPPIAQAKKAQYEDYDIKPGLVYRYWVTAVGKAGEESGPSNVVDVKTYSPAPPAAPVDVQAVAIDPGVSFDWLANTDGNLAGYNVYEPKGGNGKWRRLNSEPVTDNHYYYESGVAGQTYAVSAVNFFGVESEYVKVEAVKSVPVVYEESDPSITVEGTWATEAYVGPTNGKILVAGDTGSKLHFRFKGSQVKMIVATYWTCGSANIYVDGGLVSTVNLYSYNTTYNVVDVNLPGIKCGEHLLTVEVLGSGNPEGQYNFINVDAFEVR